MNHKHIQAAIYRRIYRLFNRKMWDIKIPGGVVSITFDDFPTSSALIASRIIREYGWHGTFYLAPGMIGMETEVGKIVSNGALADLSSEGHEVGNHTFSHIDCACSTRTTLAEEYDMSEQFLARLKGVKQFSFPYGSYDPVSLNYLSGRFRTMRTIEPGVNSGPTDLNRLKANRLYSPIDDAKIDELLQITQEQDGWLILYTHDVSETPSRFGCSVKQFVEIASKINETAIPVRSVSSVCDLLEIP